VSLWNVGNASAVKVFDDHSQYVRLNGLSFAPDGSFIVLGSGDMTVVVRFLNSPERRPITFEGHSGAVWGVAVSPDGRYVASAALDHTAKIWDFRSGKCALTFNGHRNAVYSVLFSRDGRAVFSGSYDKTVMKFEATTGRAVWTAEGHTSSVWCLAISVAGDVLASGSTDHTIRIWSSDDGKCRKVCGGHTNTVFGLDFCPTNDRILCSASNDKSMRLWNRLDGTCLFIKENAHDQCIDAVRLTFDGQRVISGSFDPTVKVWRVNGVGEKGSEPSPPSDVAKTRPESEVDGLRRALNEAVEAKTRAETANEVLKRAADASAKAGERAAHMETELQRAVEASQSCAAAKTRLEREVEGLRKALEESKKEAAKAAALPTAGGVSSDGAGGEVWSILTCPLCEQHLNTLNRRPMALECGHPVCGQCRRTLRLCPFGCAVAKQPLPPKSTTTASATLTGASSTDGRSVVVDADGHILVHGHLNVILNKMMLLLMRTEVPTVGRTEIVNEVDANGQVRIKSGDSGTVFWGTLKGRACVLKEFKADVSRAKVWAECNMQYALGHGPRDHVLQPIVFVSCRVGDAEASEFCGGGGSGAEQERYMICFPRGSH